MGSPLRLPAEDLSSKYALDLDETRAALESFDGGDVLLLAFSGKIGAGKDSVAPKTFAHFDRGSLRVESDSFGADLKIELNGLIRAIQDSAGVRRSAREIAGSYGVTLEEATHVVGLIHDEIQSGVLKSAYDRTQGSRAALQYWATEVRRNQDSLYWVKPVIRRTVRSAIQGVSTQITDVRFFTEAWGAIDIGGWTVRLDVTEAEQRRRILERDGIEISEAAKAHSSETELDSFEHFAVRIQTDNYSSTDAVALAAANGVASVASTLF